LTGLHRALTSTPSKTFGMNWNARLRARPNRPTWVLDLTSALVDEWKQVLAAMFQHLVESLPRRVEAVSSKRMTNSILMAMILEWDVRRADVHIPLVMSVVAVVWYDIRLIIVNSLDAGQQELSGNHSWNTWVRYNTHYSICFSV
jgi:hypothetical protein